MPELARNDTRKKILNWIKYKGPQDAATLANRLDISAMAVRQHLYALQGDELVTFDEESHGVGRPAKYWKLTLAADRLFPDGHSDLTIDLLSSLRSAFGDAGVSRLLEVRSESQIAAYKGQMPGTKSLVRRLNALARVRTNEGYMAEVIRSPDGSFLFVENHCSICDAARACTGLCGSELEVFQAVLGPGVETVREEHILSGDRRCAYRVRPKPQIRRRARKATKG
jgi:predicted ArsR family transcriptional regulator